MTATLLIRTRTPLQSLSMNQQPQRRKSKRGAAYDEEDDGFRFTRGAKRTKTEPAPTDGAPPRRRQSKSREDGPSIEAARSTKRQMTFTTPRAETRPEPRQGTRRSARLSNGEQATARRNDAEPGGYAVDYDTIDMVGAAAAEVEANSHIDISKESTKISLPFSDTPIIHRNKELRRATNGRRRSSLGLRGRRASSLIDSGHSAIPHPSVSPSQFYKLIESEGLSEPRRMKQLLVWCAERARGSKPAHGVADMSAGSVWLVKNQLLDAFKNRSEMSDWFQRDEPARQAVVKRPNPLDAANELRIKAMEERVKRQKQERNEWKALQKPMPEEHPLFPPDTTLSLDAFKEDLLESEDAAILESLKSMSSSTLSTSTRHGFESLQQGLEFKVDQLADGIHRLSQAREVMDRVAGKVMTLSAIRLEEREIEEKKAAGTRDMPIQEVLRSLSRIMPDGER